MHAHTHARTHMRTHMRTHARTHLVGYIVHCDKVASDRLLLSNESMQVGLGVSGASGAATVGVNWAKVVGTGLVLQVHLTPRDKCRPKALQGRQQRETGAITELPWSQMGHAHQSQTQDSNVCPHY